MRSYLYLFITIGILSLLIGWKSYKLGVWAGRYYSSMEWLSR